MSHTAPNSTLASSTLLASYSLGWDPGGRLVSMTSTADDAVTYTYDHNDQLKSATYEKPAYVDLNFSYDDNGNRTGGGNTPGPDNRQASDGVSDFTYDLDGNMTRRTDKTTGAVVEYTWDLRDRLTDVTFKSSATGPITKTVHTTYVALNRRIGKSVDTDGNGTLDQVDWVANRGLRTDRENAGDEVMLRLGTNGNVTGRYLHGASVDEILAEENIAANGTRDVLWPLADQQGSVRDIARRGADGRATIVNHVMYGPFGEKVAETDTAIAHLYGYTGREYDQETGLQYNRARYYDPKLGRFISQDPMGFEAGDTNLYRMTGNHATYASDPSGLIDPRVISPSQLEELKEIHPMLAGESEADYLKFMGVKLEEETVSISRGLVEEPVYDSRGKKILYEFASERGYGFVEGRYLVRRGGFVYEPCIVCHGRDAFGRVPGLTSTDSFVGGQWYHSGSPGNIVGNHAAGVASGTVNAFAGLANLGGHAFQGITGNEIEELIETEARTESIRDFIYPNRDRGSLITTSGEIAGQIAGGELAFMTIVSGASRVGGLLRTAPVNATSNLSPLSNAARTILQPGIERVGQMTSLPLRQPLTLSVRLSRAFVTATKTYPQVGATPIGRLLQNMPVLRNIRWEQGHVFIQQRWFRAGGPTQCFPNNAAANLGLRRLGNAGWNLVPMPRAMNSYLGRHPWASFTVGVGVAGGSAGVVGGSIYVGYQIGDYLFRED